jgi:hypothetical protein
VIKSRSLYPRKVALVTDSVQGLLNPGSHLKVLDNLLLQPGIEGNSSSIQKVVYSLNRLSYPASSYEYKNKSVITEQFVLKCTICHSEIPTLLDSWVTNPHSVNTLCPQNNCSMFKCWSVNDASNFLSSVELFIGTLRQSPVS